MRARILTLCAALLVAAPAAAQHDQHHATLNARGAKFMRFDQQTTTHHYARSTQHSAPKHPAPSNSPFPSPWRPRELRASE